MKLAQRVHHRINPAARARDLAIGAVLLGVAMAAATLILALLFGEALKWWLMQ